LINPKNTGAAMIKPPLSGIPGVGVMSDTFDFVKNLWGTMNLPGMNLPGMAAPTLSVEELDKKINDLKAVEAWLNVNQTMLRGTIQALEVQRGTIATLKSVGASMSAAIKQQPPSEKAVLESSPYASAFLFPNAQPPKEEPPADEEEVSSEGSNEGASMANPLAWWNVLQDQFKHAVNAAVVTDTMAKLGAAGTAMATDAVVKLGEVAAKSTLGASRPEAGESDAPPAPAKRIRKTTASKADSSKAAGSKAAGNKRST
jgi:hypothetical protein